MSMPSSSHVHMEGRPYCAIPNQLAGSGSELEQPPIESLHRGIVIFWVRRICYKEHFTTYPWNWY